MTWTGSCCVSESQTYFIRTIQLVFYFYLLIINTLMVWPLPPHFQCQEFGRDTMWGGQRLIERKNEVQTATEMQKKWAQLVKSWGFLFAVWRLLAEVFFFPLWAVITALCEIKLLTGGFVSILLKMLSNNSQAQGTAYVKSVEKWTKLNLCFLYNFWHLLYILRRKKAEIVLFFFGKGKIYK